jgi:hypothetical protein
VTLSTFVAVSAGAVSMACVDPFRREVRTLTVLRMTGVNDRETAEMFAELKRHTTTLALADRDLTGADHEAAVWRVYERMAA